MRKNAKLCSIIIRTRNEERWIGACLEAVFNQTYKPFEVILVDNESNDRTLEKAEKYPLTDIVTCKDYLPGKALNMGICASAGDFVVCLSGHCIPVNQNWLASLVDSLEKQPDTACVYGRQEPMVFSSDADKRDLLLVFGLDRKKQVKDSFFHNANSILRRELWEKTPFDEKTTNIEDRIWGKEMIRQGFAIGYEPEASVYHHHGIHQNGNEERCANVVRILEQLNNSNGGFLDVNALNIVAIIPVKSPVLILAGKPAFLYTLQHLANSKHIDHVYVSTDSPDIAEIAIKFGARAPFIRPQSLSQDYIGLEEVYRYSLEKIEEGGVYPDLIVTAEATFPFRPYDFVDKMITHTLKEGLDSVVAAKKENSSIWKELNAGQFDRVDSGYLPRKFKERHYVGLKGLCCVTHPEPLRSGRLLGSRVGLFEIDDPFAPIEIREKKDIAFAESLLAAWEQTHLKEKKQ